MPPPAQSYTRHRRNRPIYWFVYAVFAADFVWAASRFIRAPSFELALAVLTAVALIVLAFYARIFALTVQDRVIRLEMRLRLRELLPADLQPRIHELTRGQLVALRFAGDRELPALARRVLDERLQDKKAIKALIQEWQADHLRA